MRVPVAKGSESACHLSPTCPPGGAPRQRPHARSAERPELRPWIYLPARCFAHLNIIYPDLRSAAHDTTVDMMSVTGGPAQRAVDAWTVAWIHVHV